MMWLLEDVLRYLAERAEPGPQARAYLSFETLRSLPANLSCHCPACMPEDEEVEGDRPWA